MADIVVAGVRGALTEHLRDGLRATSGGCRRIEPDAAALASLDAGTTVVYAGLAGVGLAGVPDLERAGSCFSTVARSGAGHLVLISSAAVHEPTSRHPGHVSEERTAALRLGNFVARSWRRLEAAACDAAGDGPVALTVLRPPAVLARGRCDAFSRLFAGRLAFVPPGFDPSLQLLAASDLVSAVARVAASGAEAAGVYHLAPREVIPLKKALRAARVWRLPVPYTVQRLARKALGPRWAAPIETLDYLRYPWTVSARKIRRELGFEARRSSAEALRQAIEAPRGRAATADAATDPSAEAPPTAGPRPRPECDPFGMDPDYVARLGRTFFRFLHDFWWRVEWRGLEHVPRAGRAVLAGVHRGHQPWDGIMTFHLLVRELSRYPRYLIHPTLVKFPFLAPYMIKCGGIHACRENAAWVLEREGLLGIFPEGIRGAFSMYRDAYKLGKFGRDEYVKIALEHSAPIIPYVTVGTAEIFPIFWRLDWKWWKRVSEWPFLPVTPTMSTVPLPSKWHTRFLEPIAVDDYPPEAAGDRDVVRAISARVRRRMEAATADMLARRESIWWGSVFDDEQAPAPSEDAA